MMMHYQKSIVTDGSHQKLSTFQQTNTDYLMTDKANRKYRKIFNQKLFRKWFVCVMFKEVEMIMCRMIMNRAYLVGTDHYPMNVVLRKFICVFERMKIAVWNLFTLRPNWIQYIQRTYLSSVPKVKTLSNEAVYRVSHSWFTGSWDAIDIRTESRSLIFDVSDKKLCLRRIHNRTKSNLSRYLWYHWHSLSEK